MGNYVHQEKLLNPEDITKPVTVIGAGSVGSMVIFALAKMGFQHIEVWDHDVVSSHNVPMSLYVEKDIGALKVSALRRHIINLAGVEIHTHESCFEKGGRLSNTYVVMCVDSMKARKMIWDSVRGVPTIDLVCDTRTDAGLLTVYSLNPNNPKSGRQYAKTLCADKHTGVQICGMHGIMYVSMRAATIVAANVAKAVHREEPVWEITERVDLLQSVVN